MAQLPQRIRKETFKRDGHRCVKCNSPNKTFHAHHVVPRVFGGSDDLSNLTTLCFACHEEWHAVESASNIQFCEWLEAPCVTSFLLWYRMVKAMKDTNTLNKCSSKDLYVLLEKTYETVKERTKSP